MAITRESIWTAADQLDAEGDRPTLAAIRKKLGGGCGFLNLSWIDRVVTAT